MTNEDKSRSRGRLMLLGIGAVFFLPVMASYLLFYAFPQAVPEDTTNRGELVRPAQPVENLSLHFANGEEATPEVLRGIWTVVMLDDGRCDAACSERLLMSRQVRLSLNERRDRVRRVLIVPDARGADIRFAGMSASEVHPDLKILVDRDGTAAAFFEGAPAGSLFLIDPLGNFLMRYPPDAEPGGLRRDIVRLLRASQIG